jgi:hypothetical protein
MSQYHAYALETMVANLIRDRLLREPRQLDPLRLARHGRKICCQNDEDGILAEIFRRIGVETRRFVEIGVQDGRECNTLALLMQGWRGRWIEADGSLAAAARDRFAQFTGPGALEVVEGFAEIDTVSRLVGHAPIDLLSIDIDGNDWHVWKACANRTARVVVIEYNASWAPPVDAVSPYRPGFDWTAVGDNASGASLCALERLGRALGYSLVGCGLSGVNAFFVRRDLAVGRFREPFTAENHFEPPRYYLHLTDRGHPNGFSGVEIAPPV